MAVNVHDASRSAGAAVTQWKYEGTRGFLTNKVYQGTNGPGYTYTKASRLATCTWARGLTTSYAYNNAGELQGADYSDGTPEVTYAYDRQGRPAQITGATTNDFAFTAAGLLHFRSTIVCCSEHLHRFKSRAFSPKWPRC